MPRSKSWGRSSQVVYGEREKIYENQRSQVHPRPGQSKKELGRLFQTGSPFESHRHSPVFHLFITYSFRDAH